VEGEIIRAYLLEPGDVYRTGNKNYQVVKIENGTIYSRYWYTHGTRLSSDWAHLEIGAKSREKILLLTNKNDQNEHSN
jgi:hypothetical protein